MLERPPLGPTADRRKDEGNGTVFISGRWMAEITIEFLRRGEAGEASSVLGQAFVSNPNSVAIWRAQGEPERVKQAAVFRLLKLERRHSTVLVARQATRIVGVLNSAQWPDCQMSVLQSLLLLPRMLLIVRGSVRHGAMSRAAKLQSVWAAHDPKEPHWHLGPVGVLPEVQGQSIGTHLLQRYCELVDQHAAAAYLETDRPRNVLLYERFNFEVSAVEDIHTVPNWFMWRKPRPIRE
jgi:GNAT superfamily N-acetyltransferase